MTRLKDVAAYAGVSIKTVSNVVNEQPFVATETRTRVQKAIETLGYRPNLVARHLRRASVGVLALAIPDLANTYFSDIGNAVIAAAAQHSCTVLLDHTGSDRDHEALIASGLRPHLIDGIILSPGALQLSDLRSDRVAVPIVLLGEHLFNTPWDHVVIDNVAAAALATYHLIEIGRRRIAMLGAPGPHQMGADSPLQSALLRLQGLIQALAEAGLPFDPQYAIPAHPFHRADGAAAMHRLLDLATPPDAIFCFNDIVALGAIRVLHDRGYRVPDDLAVVGFDDIEEGLFATPSLTTISPDKKEIGRLAVELLLARIQRRRIGPPECIQPSFQLIVRESTTGRISPAALSGCPRPIDTAGD